MLAPGRADAAAQPGVASSCRTRNAAPSTVFTVYPVTSTTICAVMPPAKPPITGFAFHIALATPSPKSLARLLEGDRGRALEGVQLDLGIRGQHDHRDVGIVAGRLLHVGEGVAAGRARRAGQHEADVVVPLHQPVGVDHAERVVLALEGPHLEQDRLVARHPQPVQQQRLLARVISRLRSESGSIAGYTMNRGIDSGAAKRAG